MVLNVEDQTNCLPVHYLGTIQSRVHMGVVPGLIAPISRLDLQGLKRLAAQR